MTEERKYNTQNLTHPKWQPGQTGNPKGRPKGAQSITTVLKKIIEKKMDTIDPVTKNKDRKKIKEIIALALVGKALKGDVKAIEEILDRLEGKVTQKVEADFPLMQGRRIVVIDGKERQAQALPEGQEENSNQDDE